MQHALIFPPAKNWRTTLHYLITDACGAGGVPYCHAYRAHFCLLIFLRNDSANRHILGCGEQEVGPITPKFELERDVCTLHLIAKFYYFCKT